ncbi:unnamed protein product [Arctia plantaginis]|uniref:DM13 domain-containing protein n=1 Tax=Arctia plantaginis TaxID=874455 RepID=A0A8S1BJ30_ARCPL|nr:unnamed protein product [Arctia plantaginis]
MEPPIACAPYVCDVLAGRCCSCCTVPVPQTVPTTVAMRPAHALALLMLIGGAHAQVRYYGKEVGALSELQHGVRGVVYAVDSRTLYIHDFHYDGEGPAAYFYVGTSTPPRAGAGSLRLRDERGGTSPLRKYNGESITLSVPDGKTLRDFRWFSVYCDEYEVNFGDVSISRSIEYPRPAKVGALKGVHAVSSDPIVIVDAQTILVPNFSYDGEAPDAKFWVGRGDRPSPQGIRIPDENGKEVPLRRYDKKTVVLTLPGELTVFDIGYFAVWCEAFTVNFGHVTLPSAALANVPPSLKMLGVSPQSRNKELAGSPSHATTSSPRAARPRAPIAKLDATTYRPPSRLRPGASLFSSIQHNLEDRTNLYRRANSDNPPAEQLVQVQSSKEVDYHDEGNSSKEKYYQSQQKQTTDYQQTNYQQVAQSNGPKPYQLQEQQLQHQHRSQDPQQQNPLTPEQHYQQLFLHQQLLQQELQQRQRQLQQTQQQLYLSLEPQNSQQPINYFDQRQGGEAQQRAYQQKTEVSVQRSEEPIQYRLLPYSQS